MIGGLLISAALDACESHNFSAGCKEGIVPRHLHTEGRCSASLRAKARGAGREAAPRSTGWLVELERQEDWPGARRRTSTHPSGAFIHIGYIVVTASEMRSLVAVI